jgi:plasmid stability protein
MARKPTELRPLMIRIPEALRRKLEKEAARNDRSMNAEIIDRLQQSLTLPNVVEATANLTAMVEKLNVVNFGGASGVTTNKSTNVGRAKDEGEGP